MYVKAGKIFLCLMSLPYTRYRIIQGSDASHRCGYYCCCNGASTDKGESAAPISAEQIPNIVTAVHTDGHRPWRCVCDHEAMRYDESA